MTITEKAIHAAATGKVIPAGITMERVTAAITGMNAAAAVRTLQGSKERMSEKPAGRITAALSTTGRSLILPMTGASRSSLCAVPG